MTETLDDAAYSNVILHLLHMNDRFAKNFDRWSTDRKSDRLVLSIILTANAQIDSGLVHTLHMLYPGRVQGPFVLDKTMTIEILNHSVKAEFFAPARGPDAATERPLKRAKTDPEAGTDSDVDLAAITDHLRESLTKTNNSLCTLGKMATGRDEAGVWVSYDIVCNTRLNLAFFMNFVLGQGCVQVGRPCCSYRAWRRPRKLTMYAHRCATCVCAYIRLSKCFSGYTSAASAEWWAPGRWFRSTKSMASLCAYGSGSRQSWRDVLNPPVYYNA